MESSELRADIFKLEDFYQRASKGKRLANYLVDWIALYLLLLTIFLTGFLLAPEFADKLSNEMETDRRVHQLYLFIMYAIYMGLMETLFKGKSIGKFLTKTKVVNLDGSPINASKAFARGLLRALPFCAFSALGETSNPWQDRWTKTKVVNDI